MEIVRPTRRLIDLCCTAVDRFANAYRNANWRAGTYRTFRANIVVKASQEYIRENSPLGEVSRAIAEVGQLPEDERCKVEGEVSAWAQRKATELNETATQPLGKRPMQNWAAYTLEPNETHQQASSVSGTAGPGLQFAFYNPPSSSSAPQKEPGPSVPRTAGPVRRKRQSRKKPSQSTPLAPSRAGVGQSKMSTVEILDIDTAAVDADKLAEENLKFNRALYSIHRPSSTSGQGSSGAVHRHNSTLGFPTSAQSNHGSNASSHGGTVLLNTFDGRDLTSGSGGQYWDPQQIFDRVGFSGPASDTSSSPASYMDVSVQSSQSSSVYYTPVSTRSLELDGGQENPYVCHGSDTTHGTAGPSSFFDANRSGLVRLPPLPEVPLAGYGGQDGHMLWSSTPLQEYQDTTNMSSTGHYFSSSDPSSALPLQHRQALQSHIPSSPQPRYPTREQFSAWQDNHEGACQAGRHLQRIAHAEYSPGVAQALPSVGVHGVCGLDQGFPSSRNFPWHEIPPHSNPSTIRGGDGYAVSGDFGAHPWAGVSYDTGNASFHKGSSGLNLMDTQAVYNPVATDAYPSYHDVFVTHPPYGDFAYGQGQEHLHPPFASSMSSTASSAGLRNPPQRVRLVVPRSHGQTSPQSSVLGQRIMTDPPPFTPMTLGTSGYDPPDLPEQYTFAPHRTFGGSE